MAGLLLGQNIQTWLNLRESSNPESCDGRLCWQQG